MTTQPAPEKFGDTVTPFYYYDLNTLRATLDTLKKESESSGYKVHYAVKSNYNPRILDIISSYGFGADCVSGNEITAVIKAGFKPSDIVFAGVGKTDREIETALTADISCFNCESIPEIEVINSLAARTNKTAHIALRINPHVEAHTHKYITTAVEESKFGINTWELDSVISKLGELENIKLTGIHFHIGSQITLMSVFRNLCTKLNDIQRWFSAKGIHIETVNVGGGLGIDYEDPSQPPRFKEYFAVFRQHAELLPGQTLHMELGRSVTGQCGSLIARTVFIKSGKTTRFAIIDAGMTDLIRPALYQARHKIENLSSKSKTYYRYDVVGPICESSDTFAQSVELPETQRGDFIAIRSAGAYGEAMASRYNLRNIPASYFSDDFLEK